MLSRIDTISRQEDFRVIKQKGNAWRGKHLRISALKSDRWRVAIIVSKKVSDKAVVRNKIRRQLMSIIREVTGVKDYTWDLIISVLPGQREVSYQQWEKEINEALDTLQEAVGNNEKSGFKID